MIERTGEFLDNKASVGVYSENFFNCVDIGGCTNVQIEIVSLCGSDDALKGNKGDSDELLKIRKKEKQVSI